MSYIEVSNRGNVSFKQDDLLASKRFVIEHRAEPMYFYELEEAVVLDIIMDEKHPEFKNSILETAIWPPNIDGSSPKKGDKDYSKIGMIKFRFLQSEVGKTKQSLNWAFPIENTGITEWPLYNEVVIVGQYMNKYFYSRKLNISSVVNTNANFKVEQIAGLTDKNYDEYSASSTSPMKGPTSKLTNKGGNDYSGVLGGYFKFNHHIRALRRYEGDTILESRFGSSIRFGAYDKNRANDVGAPGEYSGGGGNPMILFRNRQAPVKEKEGYTAKGLTLEDINKDGSSIHITSGKTTSEFKTTTEKPMISGLTTVKLPKLDGDQIVINSDRVIISSKANEMFFFSKKDIGMVTDKELHIDAKEKITITTLKTTSINSPKIYLGDHAKTYEPALLGRTTITWLKALVNVMIDNIDTQVSVLRTNLLHFHGSAVGPTTPPLPPAAIQWGIQIIELQKNRVQLVTLRSQLSSLLSNRVFVSGGVD